MLSLVVEILVVLLQLVVLVTIQHFEIWHATSIHRQSRMQQQKRTRKKRGTCLSLFASFHFRYSYSHRKNKQTQHLKNILKYYRTKCSATRLCIKSCSRKKRNVYLFIRSTGPFLFTLPSPSPSRQFRSNPTKPPHLSFEGRDADASKLASDAIVGMIRDTHTLCFSLPQIIRHWGFGLELDCLSKKSGE